MAQIILCDYLEAEVGNDMLHTIFIFDDIAGADAMHVGETFDALFWTDITDMKNAVQVVGVDVGNILEVTGVERLTSFRADIILGELNVETSLVLRERIMRTGVIDDVNFFAGQMNLKDLELHDVSPSCVVLHPLILVLLFISALITGFILGMYIWW